jgi:hypothetical protein
MASVRSPDPGRLEPDRAQVNQPSSGASSEATVAAAVRGPGQTKSSNTNHVATDWTSGARFLSWRDGFRAVRHWRDAFHRVHWRDGSHAVSCLWFGKAGLPVRSGPGGSLPSNGSVAV